MFFFKAVPIPYRRKAYIILYFKSNTEIEEKTGSSVIDKRIAYILVKMWI